MLACYEEPALLPEAMVKSQLVLLPEVYAWVCGYAAVGGGVCVCVHGSLYH